mgnify:FL=1
MTKKTIATIIMTIMDEDLRWGLRPIVAYERLRELAEDLEKEDRNESNLGNE